MESGGPTSKKLSPKSPMTGSTGESPNTAEQDTLANRVFQKFYFCKMKVIEKGPGKGVIRKNFWVFPPVDANQITREEQAEADILSGFGFQKMTSTDPGMEKPVIYISEFFSKFRASNTRKFWFVLNQNQQQQYYVNEYNSGGVRHFFGLTFDDFELVPETKKLVKTQGLFLIESKFPFRTFMFKMLEIIFDLVRVHRLSQYSMNFNGDSQDPINLETCNNYDSSSLVQVTQKQSTSFLGKLIMEQADRQMNVCEEEILSAKYSFKPDALMGDYYEAVESKLLFHQVSH